MLGLIGNWVFGIFSFWPLFDIWVGVNSGTYNTRRPRGRGNDYIMGDCE